MEYDEQVIREFAGRLYKRARSIVLTYTFFGAIIGAGVGVALGEAIGLMIGLAIGIFIGYSLGEDRAFTLKQQAQTSLCLAQIEKNTRS